jgi:hypothetical protein
MQDGLPADQKNKAGWNRVFQTALFFSFARILRFLPGDKGGGKRKPRAWWGLGKFV